MYLLERNVLLRKAVLGLVLQHEPISRKTLQKYLHVRLATLTEITRDLINEGFIVENGSIAGDGLKKALCINRESYCALGVALVKGSMLSVLINLKGEEIEHVRQPVSDKIDSSALTKAIQKTFEDMRAKYPARKYLGVGVSISAAMNFERNQILSSSMYPNLSGINLKRQMQEICGVPVFLEISSNTYILTEKWFGTLRHISSALYLELGETLGAGILVDSKILHGTFGVEGEFGHMMVERNGQLCTCGNKGCLETVASGKHLKARLLQLLENGAHSIVDEMADGNMDTVCLATIDKAAQMGDKICLALLEEASDYIGMSLANIINMLGSGAVVMGGDGLHEDSILAKMIIDKTRRNLYRYEWIVDDPPVAFYISKYGEFGMAIGAATLAIAPYMEPVS